jgi:hypothetical protein
MVLYKRLTFTGPYVIISQKTGASKIKLGINLSSGCADLPVLQSEALHHDPLLVSLLHEYSAA